jgi:formate dehydrogenase major subunit
VPGLGTSFGRGGATTAQQDLANADCVLIQGSSMAEAHPVGFRWVMKAKERGAKLIHVDPRFSRTSAMADLWVPLRAGTDIVFLGGLVNHVLRNGLEFRDYVTHFTNASCILREDFRDAHDGDGFFSGWDGESRTYDPASWAYEGGDLGHPRRDLTLEHPRCVFQALKRHFARYTEELVEQVCGVPPELFRQVAETVAAASGPERTTAICYAVGWTQHSVGVQIIRTAAILQLLLGNIGRPGGGILALRGHASIQGSTDIPTLFDILPGYMPMPKAGEANASLEGYWQHAGHRTGLWSEIPSYSVSLLKAYYGRNATADNQFGWGWLPRTNRDHSHYSYFTDMEDGKVEGFFLMGQNPAVGAVNGRLERRALARLKWMVVRDLVEIESASFWYASPEVERGEIVPEQTDTEVFLLPAAGHAEKEGTFTNTQRMLQWREKAVDPPGDARSEAWFIHQLAKRLRARAAASDDPNDEPLRALDWWYPEDEAGEPVIEAVQAEINGWRTDPAEGPEGVVHGKDAGGRPHHGPQVKGLAELRADGSTACGCWIYSGVYGPDGINRAAQRTPAGPYGHGWGFAWPSDRRILYNRCSARPDGRPWSERKKLVWWDEQAGKWTGTDMPDFPATKPPGYVPPADATGMAAHPGDAPFILHDDGLGWLFVPAGLKDGPLPTHFEPLESPFANPVVKRQTNPPEHWFPRDDNRFAPPGDPRFPHVLTTFRLTEHHTGGGMSRTLSHLAELQPEQFLELSSELAAELGVATGDWVTVVTLRSALEARAMVTRRMRPLVIDGRTVHQVALPFHWAWNGLVKGDVTNDLIGISGEPNVTIQESKALTCRVEKGRRRRGPALVQWIDALLADSERHPEEEPRPKGGGA